MDLGIEGGYRISLSVSPLFVVGVVLAGMMLSSSTLCFLYSSSLGLCVWVSTRCVLWSFGSVLLFDSRYRQKGSTRGTPSTGCRPLFGARLGVTGGASTRGRKH